MTIDELRDLLVEEYIEVDVSVDLGYDITDGDQFPEEDLIMLEVLKSMLKVCSEEQINAVRAKVVARKQQEMEDEEVPF